MSNPTSVPLRIQLITFSGCPNASAARSLIERTVADAGILGAFEEIDTFAPETPAALREWGSPTILVNGKDVGGEREPTGPSCRLYRGDDGRAYGVPSMNLLLAALNRALNDG